MPTSRFTSLFVAIAASWASRSHAQVRSLTLIPPHVEHRPAARLSAALSTRIAAIFRGALPTPEALIERTLRVTREHLHFGMAHRTSLHFGAAEREAHCIEYAHLWATVFNQQAQRRGVAATALVMRSDARLFGVRIERRGWSDHDWVRVRALDGRQWLVDPTLDDTVGQWNIGGQVQ
jgi:hypothetical protein